MLSSGSTGIAETATWLEAPLWARGLRSRLGRASRRGVHGRRCAQAPPRERLLRVVGCSRAGRKGGGEAGAGGAELSLLQIARVLTRRRLLAAIATPAGARAAF